MGMTAYVVALSTRDAFGKEVGGATERTIACYYAPGTSSVVDQDGKQLPVNIEMYTNDTSIAITDRIRISTITYRIVSVKSHYNEKGLMWGQEVALT